MVNFKLLLAFASGISYVASSHDDDVLQVNISIDKAEVHRGDSVTYTCTWNLDAQYGKQNFGLREVKFINNFVKRSSPLGFIF